MTYRSASRSRATQNAVRRQFDDGKTRPPFLVVELRQRLNNQRGSCVYRKVYPFWQVALASTRMAWSAEGGYAALIESASGNVLSELGDTDLPDKWMAQRKGINKHADWRTAGTYMERETASLTHRLARGAREEFEG